MPAVASSLTFSLWIGVRNSLLKRPNQHRFAMCDRARFRLACSIINKKKDPINYDLRGNDYGSFRSACSNILELLVNV